VKVPVLAAFILLVMAGVAVADHVSGLDPNGDNYLSLRSGPGSKFGEIDRLDPNTIVSIVERSGSWKRVRLEDGTEGWVFGKYILPGLPAGMEEPTVSTDPALPGDAADYDEAPIDGDAAPDNPLDTQTEAQSAPPVDVEGIVSDISQGLDGSN
jgi:Bacterial SH3 domain